MADVKNMDWTEIHTSLNEKGYAVLREVLSRAECEHLMSLYEAEHLYRSTINMQRYRFGKGEYKYFRYPLPGSLQCLRELLYAPLANVANEWMEILSLTTRFPNHHHELIRQCHSHEQPRPTPLILATRLVVTTRCTRICTGQFIFLSRW